ncbi:ATP-dependent helicase HrpB [Paenibacillus harenae]|uniref:ATP-dependent helicase HrpB n=1 Tax=Paenibacillus harenae TaxID=306543 RepID=A0ABT9UAN6_PAEHA|nr:ATP-dependent helicase HrpB [Paenibacillus harenae]MDQ0116717.1 ATP-dependent helicase HrpB [Paenibacillus harenae]
MNQQQLPIDAVLPELLESLRKGVNAVLIAEPGAGKTTRVPLALLDEPWLHGKRIVMLEPRRLAARSAAQYMARTLGEQAGETVGYRVRLETKVSAKTRIEVVTEGVLTRMLQEDAALEHVGAILFDEFHERHLHGDLGLALSLQSQSLLREELRLIVMSATLDAEPLAALLSDAPIIRSEGRVFPVITHYAAARPSRTERIEQQVGSTIVSALRSHEGDVLAFLPGALEIRRTASWLAASGMPTGVRIAELYGTMPLSMQDAAVAPCLPGERKIVLATSIAESSLTVQGVTIVVDSGLMRVPRFSPRTGMTRLETVAVSQASADQRRGRAGRLAPGVCYRLWTEQEHPYLPAQSAPEIADADLAPLALELAVWGIQDPAELDWLTPPPQAAYEQATELLKKLRALDPSGKPTPEGFKLARFGMHPRLGAMVLRAEERGCANEGCELAAILSERDLLPQERSVDIKLRLDALNGKMASADPAAIRRIAAQAEQWKRLAAHYVANNASPSPIEKPSLGTLLAAAYPDRIAQRRSDGRYLLANGRGAVLPDVQPLSRSDYLAACELDDAGTESRIRLAAELTLTDIEQFMSPYITVEEAIEWDRAALAVRSRRRTKLGAIVLGEVPISGPDEEKVADALIAGIRSEGMGLLPMTKPALALQARMKLMALGGKDWPEAADEALLGTLEEWLKPHLYGMKNRSDLQRLNMVQLLGSMLSWAQQQELDEQVPTHFTVPSGSRIPIDYSDPAAPVLAVRLQEMFGLQDTPRLARGKLPLTLHLLSPSQRPVQVTQDLRSFWESAYFEVKKDLKGRYPKHYWPDDPYSAMPTNRVKPRGT